MATTAAHFPPQATRNSTWKMNFAKTPKMQIFYDRENGCGQERARHQRQTFND
jgi:hypothetical protein